MVTWCKHDDAALCTKQMKEKKKQLKKDGKPVFVEEDDPEMVMQSHLPL